MKLPRRTDPPLSRAARPDAPLLRALERRLNHSGVFRRARRDGLRAQPAVSAGRAEPQRAMHTCSSARPASLALLRVTCTVGNGSVAMFHEFRGDRSRTRHRKPRSPWRWAPTAATLRCMRRARTSCWSCRSTSGSGSGCTTSPRTAQFASSGRTSMPSAACSMPARDNASPRPRTATPSASWLPSVRSGYWPSLRPAHSSPVIHHFPPCAIRRPTPVPGYRAATPSQSGTRRNGQRRVSRTGRAARCRGTCALRRGSLPPRTP